MLHMAVGSTLMHGGSGLTNKASAGSKDDGGIDWVVSAHMASRNDKLRNKIIQPRR